MNHFIFIIAWIPWNNILERLKSPNELMRQLVTCRHKIIKTEISKSLQIAVLRTKVYARALRPYQAKHLDEISVSFLFRIKKILFIIL